MVGVITAIVVTVVSVFFFAVMYKGLHEPVDLVARKIAQVFQYAGVKVANSGGAVEVIRYD